MKRIIVFAFMLLLLSCSEKTKNDNEKIEPRVPVKVTKVKYGTIYETISLCGDIHDQKEVKVYSKVPGKLIRKVKTEGSHVRENETIALVNRDEPAMDFADAEVKSPIDGVVTQYFVGLGESVFPAQSMVQTPIVMVANIEKMKIEVYASESEINKISKGMSARIYTDVYQNKIFWGKVVEIDRSVNSLTRKAKIQIEVPNQNYLLKPGMFARVDIITRVHKNVLVVPNSSVLSDPLNPEKKIVFIVEQDIAKKVEVKVGVKDEEKAEIISGLTNGQDVITEGNFCLADGAKLLIQGGP